jgi:hypothetical protein
MPRNIMFLGPTGATLADPSHIVRAGFEVRPPAAREDIRALLAEAPGRIVIVDGRFNHVPAVGHAEIRDALGAGWEIWGLGSMGAIRAFEMRTFGMRGFGTVYGHFLAERDFQDDEVALLHATDAPYASFSEPLVHLRHCLAALEHDAEIMPDAARDVLHSLKALWFGYRTLEAFVAAVRERAGDATAQCARRRVQAFDPYRVKTADLVAFIENEMWLHPYAPSGALPVPLPYGDTPPHDVAPITP